LYQGSEDCARNPGALGHEQKDADFFAKYQVDWSVLSSMLSVRLTKINVMMAVGTRKTPALPLEMKRRSAKTHYRPVSKLASCWFMVRAGFGRIRQHEQGTQCHWSSHLVCLVWLEALVLYHLSAWCASF
jgi:hypothetical protein